MQLQSSEECLRRFFSSVDANPEVERVEAILHLSLKRMIEGSNGRSGEYEQFMWMLTMLDGNNLTNDLLVSCAKVIISNRPEVILFNPWQNLIAEILRELYTK